MFLHSLYNKLYNPIPRMISAQDWESLSRGLVQRVTALNRFLDTMIGIVIGVAVNLFRFPHHKNLETLFISGLDDTLLISYLQEFLGVSRIVTFGTIPDRYDYIVPCKIQKSFYGQW